MNTHVSPRTRRGNGIPAECPAWLAEALARIEAAAKQGRPSLVELGRLAYSIREAADISGLGRSSIYVAIRDGQLKVKKHGRRTLILADDLKSYLQSLPQVEPEAIRTGSRRA
jgi:excisionase family DNA binding protein